LRDQWLLLGGARGGSALDLEAGRVAVSDGEAQVVRPGFFTNGSLFVSLKHQTASAGDLCD
jgi:hypothetical protein